MDIWGNFPGMLDMNIKYGFQYFNLHSDFKTEVNTNENIKDKNNSIAVELIKNTFYLSEDVKRVNPKFSAETVRLYLFNCLIIKIG